MEEARLQSAYDGAALVYARNQALSLISKPDPPGHAEVRTFSTDGTNVNFYAHYAALLDEDGTVKYHQYQYASANIKDTYQGHKNGRKGVRNEQDHAKDQSYILRDQLKEYWKQCCSALQPVTEQTASDLNDVPEEPLPVQEGNLYPDDDGKVEELLLSAKAATQGEHTRRKVPPVRDMDKNSEYKIIDKPSYMPTPQPSFEERRRSARLLNSRQLPSENGGNIAAKKHMSSHRNGKTTADYKCSLFNCTYFTQLESC
jgi:hypothetical protein